jgi:hypothetical protein
MKMFGHGEEPRFALHTPVDGMTHGTHTCANHPQSFRCLAENLADKFAVWYCPKLTIAK